MSDPHATAEQIGEAGIQVFISMYGGKCRDSLNGLRYAKFMEMVASSRTSLDPQKLPPTERAAFFHSLRVHLQVILWKKLVNDHDDLNPEQWGWKLDGTMFAPITTDLAAAPENYLKFVRCKCKLSSKNPCGTNICSCHKNGLKCVTACGDCRGKALRTLRRFFLMWTKKMMTIDSLQLHCVTHDFVLPISNYSSVIFKIVIKLQTWLNFFPRSRFERILDMLFYKKKMRF